MEDNTIPSLVQTKATRPDVYVASANVVNQPLMSWVHWGLGAVKPYFPELPREFHFFFNRSNWRPSSLPSWSWPGYGKFNSSKFVPLGTQRHRWLPLRGKTAYLRAN